MRKDQQPADSYDVAVLGGGLAGLSVALQLKRRARSTSVRGREAEGAGARGGVQGRRVHAEIGAHYFGARARPAGSHRARPAAEDGRALLPPAGDNGDITKRAEYGPPVPARSTLPARPRSLRERARGTGARGRGRPPRRLRVQDVELGDDGARGHLRPGRRGGVDAVGALADRGDRTRLALAGSSGARAGDAHDINSAWFRLAGGMDIEDWADDAEWLGRMTERGLRWLQHEPPDGRGLLGVADPALLGVDLDRDRRRPEPASVRAVRDARRRVRVATGARAPARGRARGPRATRSRTTSRCAHYSTAPSGSSRRSAGA